MKIDFSLNNELQTVEAPPRTSLLSILKEHFEYPSPFSECGKGYCIHCMVLFNDYAAASCLIPAFNVQGNHVETIDGIVKLESYQYISQGFEEASFSPCRRCLPSRIILTESILRKERSPIQVENSAVLQYIADSNCACSSRSAFVRGIKNADHLRNKWRHGYADRD